MTTTDIDTLHILPLADLPLESKLLRGARLVKNVHLEGMIELFKEKGSGSGQIPPANMLDFFDMPDENNDDYILINKLSKLPSYDVYSLRVSLRDLGIDLATIEKLKLSDGKTRELTRHMGEFTRPLVKFVYGDSGNASANLSELIKLFADPNANVARENLGRLAKLLDVDLMRIPKFLEDYADVYMSLSFYRACLEELTPLLANFLIGLQAIRASDVFRDDRVLLHDCRAVEHKLSLLYNDVKGVLDDFRDRTGDMWEDPTAEKYRTMEAIVLGRQARIGQILCALTVKMMAWNERFPPEARGELSAKAAFVVAEMKYGLSKVRPLSETDAEDEAEAAAAAEDARTGTDDGVADGVDAGADDAAEAETTADDPATAEEAAA